MNSVGLNGEPLTKANLGRSPRILIVRLSAIGDVIHGIPFLCALRKALPDSFVAWIVEGAMGDVLDGQPAVKPLHRQPALGQTLELEN